MFIYDTIVIGAGPAGLACAIELSQFGVSCLVIEARAGLNGVICGDGLSDSSIKALIRLGINIDHLNGKKIKYKKEYRDDKVIKTSFFDLFGVDYEIGIPRDYLDLVLLEHALKCGVQVLFNTPFLYKVKQNGYYLINNDYLGKSVVFACGVLGGKRLGLSYPANLPVGFSARIKGTCTLDEDAFHYYYSEKYGDGYAWAFPVGDNLWNIGVWNHNKKNALEKLYYDLEKKIFDQKIFLYDRKPGGRIIGAGKFKYPSSTDVYYIGDCALMANPLSGEGVAFAMSSGIQTAEKIIGKNII